MSYPYRPSIVEDLVALVPGACRKGFWLHLLGAVGDGVQRIEDEQAAIGGFLADPRACSGVWLDRWGAVVDEPRDGLGDVEYLAIIEAKIAALTAGGTVDGLNAVWKALAFGPVRYQLRERVASDGSVEVYLQAEISSMPSTTYLRRAGPILEDALAAGVTGYGVLYLDGGIHSPRPGVYPDHTHAAIISGDLT